MNQGVKQGIKVLEEITLIVNERLQAGHSFECALCCTLFEYGCSNDMRVVITPTFEGGSGNRIISLFYIGKEPN